MRVMHLLSSGQYIAHLYKTNIKRFYSFFNPFYILTYWPLAQSCRIFRIDYEIIPSFMKIIEVCHHIPPISLISIVWKT